MNPLSVSAHSKKAVFPDETERRDDKSVCKFDMVMRFMAETPFFDLHDIILARIRGAVNKPQVYFFEYCSFFHRHNRHSL